jgi:hypothetical protein
VRAPIVKNVLSGASPLFRRRPWHSVQTLMNKAICFDFPHSRKSVTHCKGTQGFGAVTVKERVSAFFHQRREAVASVCGKRSGFFPSNIGGGE